MNHDANFQCLICIARSEGVSAASLCGWWQAALFFLFLDMHIACRSDHIEMQLYTSVCQLLLVLNFAT